MERGLPPAPFLYPIVDVAALGPRAVGAAVAALAAGGASLVQFRAKDLPAGRFLELAREALAAARGQGIRLIVNDRADVCRILGADGLHLGQDDLEVAEARRLLPSALLGLSTHDLGQVERAAGQDVDYIAVGPIYATRSKARPDPVVGTELLRQARRMTDRPLVAIGGITRATARATVEAGADGLAVISDLLSAPDLTAAARELLDQMRTSGPGPLV